MNEWGSHDISPEDYADAYNEAISYIRTFYDGNLIVDVPGFGQATKIAADAYVYMEDDKFTYSIHVYTSAFNREQERWLSHEDLVYLNDTGADCMVGEFCDNSTGGTDWCSIIDNCYANGWPLMGWAWNGDGGHMNMVTPHWEDDPLATHFEPTSFLKVITDKLAGIPCYTQPDDNCDDSLIGAPCDDGNDYTVSDKYNEYCHCAGTFNAELQFNTSDKDLILYPNPVAVDQLISVDLFKISGTGHVLVHDGLGQLILSEPVKHNQNTVVIETSAMVSGLYWASYHDGDRILVSKAFYVNYF